MSTESEVEACRRLAEKYDAEVEVPMPDETRCDLLSDEYAIEVDWATKWAEAIGQTTLYSIWTRRKPAVLLLLQNADDDKPELLRAALVCERLGITLFVEVAE